jgi:23S rRNA pseudouridine1911/1915/1917 synthase
MAKKIKISSEESGRRLDVFLTEKFTDQSRSFWQKQIKRGAVTVNGENVTVHNFLKNGDVIEIGKEDVGEEDIVVSTKYKIIFQCSDYLVVEKPAGVLTHRAGKEPGLADKLSKDFPEIKKIGEEGRWGSVHRLDREVSGVMVVARSKKFYDNIKKQFEERKTKKIYLGLVYGEVPRDEDDLNFAIGRGESGKMAARPTGEDGREARTHFEVLEKFKNYTYLQIQIFTGRTHQIRAHMLAYGYPIVGDKIYALRKQKIKDPGCDRIFLHSHKLGFADLKGNEVEYKSELPKELAECLKKLKK